MRERRRISVEGIVQGVGFRPYVHGLATAGALRGFVRNEAGGVVIEVEGEPPDIERFLSDLTAAPPPLAVIDRVQFEATEPVGDRAFAIAASGSLLPQVHASASVISPDAATCDACIRELFEPSNRRYRYPFISCAHCGPRLTIVEQVPYDRVRTSMASFGMCPLCTNEYHDPRDRRFHAQTNACEDCGPSISLLRPDSRGSAVTGEEALAAAVRALRAGEVVAVKGLGGFHIACDATNPAAIRRLRARKHRETKSLAVMVADVDAARGLATISVAEERLLRASERPIVLLEKVTGRNALLEAIAPDNSRVGIMLPYTPLHLLLLADVGGRALVMTSANVSGEPIVYDDVAARVELGTVADAILMHDRRIVSRCDDSVARVRPRPGGPSSDAFVRRSRGYAPRPVHLGEAIRTPILGVGGHLKNTFCLAQDRLAILSHHIGDLETAAARVALTETIDRYARLFQVRPRVVVHDRHPDYASTHAAHELGAERLIAVQHHHAHVMSCLAEHGVTEPAIGVAFDGAGLGWDGAVWGGELLFVEGSRCERLGHMGYVPLPGGDAATLRPWRAAAAHLWNACAEGEFDLPDSWRQRGAPGEMKLLEQMLSKRVRSPLTSSVGRFFDAVASIIGVRDDVHCEGEAAIALESVAERGITRTYRVETHREGSDDRLIVEPSPVIRGVVADVRAGRPTSEIAGVFHNTLCAIVVAMVADATRRTGVRRVVLTGGVFQNALLEELVASALTGLGNDVLLHGKVPCNDGGLCLGQVVAGSRLLSAEG